MKRYSNIHRKQLFHWIGHHIDYPTDGAQQIELDDAARKKYLDALKGAIRNGLWVKKPRDPDRLGNKATPKHFEVSRPITCFTEWPVGESLPHTTRYGRLGLGFPRRFVFERGGHPLIYVRGILSGDQYTRNLLTLKEFLSDDRLVGIFGEEKINDHQRRLDYITHFAKWSRIPPIPGSKAKARLVGYFEARRRREKSAMSKDEVEEINFERSYGQRQELLEEREWRVVYHSTFGRHFKKSIHGPNSPEYYMPFAVGEDLFTVVLPDNKTVNMAMNDSFFIRKFYPGDSPHVTVLSLDDIGTY